MTKSKYISRIANQLVRNPLAFIFCLGFNLFSVIFYVLYFKIGKLGSSTNISFFFKCFTFNCAILVPLLFSLFENSNFTDWPVSPLKINLCRIFTVTCFLTLTIIFSLPVVFAVKSFGYVDFAKVFCSFIGLVLYFILCGSFVSFVFSCVFNSTYNSTYNRGIGFAISVIFLVILNFLFFAKFSSFSKGSLVFKDFCFFVIFSFLFLYLGDLVVKIKTGYKFNMAKNEILLGAAFIILSLIFCNLWNFRIDFSASKKNSISKCTKELFSNAEFPVELTYYYSNQLTKLYPETSDTLDFLKEIGKLKNARVKSIKVKPASDLEKKLEALGIKGQNVQSGQTNSVTYTKVFAALAINYGGVEDFIPFAVDSVTLEYNLDLKLANYLSGNPMNVAIVCGNNLSLEQDYSYLIAFLEASGFAVRKVFLPLNQMSFIPGETIFVLGTENFSSSDAEIFEEKLFAGYKAFICTSTNNVDFTNWQVTQKSDYITKLLGSFGAVFGADLIQSDKCHKMNFFSQNGSDVEQVDYSLWPIICEENSKIKGNGFVSVWPSYLQIFNEENSQSQIKPVLVTSKNSWLQPKYLDKYEVNPFVLNQLTHLQSEENQFVVGADVKGKFYGYRTVGTGNVQLKIFADQYSFSNNIMNLISNGGIPDTRSFSFAVDSILELKGLGELKNVHNKSNYPEYVYKESKNVVFPFVYVLCCIFVFACWSILILIFVLIRKFNNKKIYSLVEELI